MNVIKISKERSFQCKHSNLKSIQDELKVRLGLNSNDYYLLINGKRVRVDQLIKSSVLHVIVRVYGGKGGFGSMLRAIGAQIEKTTNREACRDLSGRRLRDINDEKKIKIWMKEKEERKQKAAEKRREKLEKILEGPKIEMVDDREFYEARSKLPENLEEAISEGLKQSSFNQSGEKRASCSSSGNLKSKKKKKILFDDDDDVSSTDNEVEDKKSN